MSLNETLNLDDFDFDKCFAYVVKNLDNHEYIHDSIQNFIEANYHIEDVRKVSDEDVMAIEAVLDKVVSQYLGIEENTWS